MSDGERDPVARLARLSPVWRRRVLASLTADQLNELNDRWWAWAHAGQVAPPGDWAIWLIRAGRGFGKTRAGAEWVHECARTHPGARIALVGSNADDVRRVMVEGQSGLIAVARDDEPMKWRKTTGLLHFNSGAKGYVYSAEAPETLRGPEHHFAWCDELAKWRPGGEAAWDNLRMGMRLGPCPRVLVTTTPRRQALLMRVMAAPGLVETRGRTRDNPHLPGSFVSAMVADYGDTRLGRQELDGELLDDVAGALWTRAMLDAGRVRPKSGMVPDMVRVVVGVDPPAGIGGDACGIVAAGLGTDGRGYVLEDATVHGLSPERWAHAVVACYERHGGDRVVAEANQGGAMVASVLKGADAALPVTLVHASKGKVARAEPVAALYEAGRVSHVGALPALEDELCGLAAGGVYEGPGRSPDRADACVWALTSLMLGKAKVGAGVRTIG